MRVAWESTSASRESFTSPSARCSSRSMSTISAAILDIISAYAVVEATNPAPTIAIRGTLGSNHGCAEIACSGNSISESRMDRIFSSRRWVTSHRWSPSTNPTAEICIQRCGPYESARDRRVLVLAFCVTSKCGYLRSLCTDSCRIPTLH